MERLTGDAARGAGTDARDFFLAYLGLICDRNSIVA